MTFTIHAPGADVSALQSRGCWVLDVGGELESFSGDRCEELARGRLEFLWGHGIRATLHPAKPAIQGV